MTATTTTIDDYKGAVRADLIRWSAEVGAHRYTNRHLPGEPAHAFGIAQLERLYQLIAEHLLTATGSWVVNDAALDAMKERERQAGREEVMAAAPQAQPDTSAPPGLPRDDSPFDPGTLHLLFGYYGVTTWAGVIRAQAAEIEMLKAAATAAQPARQPLTDAQIDTLHDARYPAPFFEHDRQNVRLFARDIEQAHGIGPATGATGGAE